MAVKSLPDPELLRKLLRYEPETGKLFWKKRTPDMFSEGKHTAEHQCNRWNVSYPGREAFTADSYGYKCGRIMDCRYQAHRVIWAIHTGVWPKNQIDHIDGDRSNNRISNLREATPSENSMNLSRRSDNTSGVVGVSQKDGLWRARIYVNKREVSLGSFRTIKEAKKARLEAEAEYGYHPNHGR